MALFVLIDGVKTVAGVKTSSRREDTDVRERRLFSYACSPANLSRHEKTSRATFYLLATNHCLLPPLTKVESPVLACVFVGKQLGEL